MIQIGARVVHKLKRSCRISAVVVEHPAETLASSDFSIRGTNLQRWLDNSTSKSLMVSLPVIILEILGDHTSQMFLSKKNYSIHSLPLEGAMESLQGRGAVG
jgi:hypothetical protein